SHLANVPIETRNPASLQPRSELKRLHEKLSVHQKIKPPIRINIDKNLIGKIYAGDEFEVTATVSSEVDTKNVKVEWSLPQYLQVISGELMHSFAELKAGEQKTVRISLISHSEENQQIHIFASAPYGKQVLSAVDQFNTTDEEDIKNAKSDLVKRNLDYIDQSR
ncbi:MAG: hypothetical protein KDD40_06165, partial [Bdellovibrionales bacterium]|nr:hypothetical protein [Bdellovibrionales bacterium]